MAEDPTEFEQYWSILRRPEAETRVLITMSPGEAIERILLTALRLKWLPSKDNTEPFLTFHMTKDAKFKITTGGLPSGYTNGADFRLTSDREHLHIEGALEDIFQKFSKAVQEYQERHARDLSELTSKQADLQKKVTAIKEIRAQLGEAQLRMEPVAEARYVEVETPEPTKAEPSSPGSLAEDIEADMDIPF